MGIKNNSINMTYLFIIIGLIGNRCLVNAQQLTGIDTLRQFAADSFDIMKTVYDDAQSESSTPSTADIMDKVKGIIPIIDKWDDGLKEKLEAMNTLILSLSSGEGIKQDLRDLAEYIRRINDLYGKFAKYVKTPDSLSEDEAGELSEIFTSEGEEGVISSIRGMYSVIYPETWGNYKDSPLITIARKTQEISATPCDIGNLQQRFLDFYPVILVTEMKALTMTYFGHLIKSLKEDVGHIDDMKMAEEKFLKRVEKYLIILRNAVKVVARKFRSCDPPEGHTRDESFYEFQRFLQNVVADEITLTQKGDCSDTCSTVGNPTRIHRCQGVECDEGEPLCSGSMRRCTSLNWKADLCSNDEYEPRRYEWVRDGWGTYHPDETHECTGRIHYPRWQDGWIYECDICRCLCVEDTISSPSYHFISLREQLSNVEDNMVIVGLQFQLLDRILHMSIRQGLLESNETITKHISEWKPPQDVRFDEFYSIDSGRFNFYGDTDERDNADMIEDEDVAVLTWDSRRIYLDALTTPPNHLVTGVRFVRDVKEKSKPIHLEIQATPFDYESGKLDPKKSIWIGPKDTSYGKNKERRTQYKGEGHRNPEKLKNTAIDTKPNAFIDVEVSSWEYDASQTVLPLLDGREASFNPPIPLKGVGLYHKSQKGYGGFLTFMLEGVDIAPNIKNPRTGR